jgi:hypothetical protein
MGVVPSNPPAANTNAASNARDNFGPLPATKLSSLSIPSGVIIVGISSSLTHFIFPPQGKRI